MNHGPCASWTLYLKETGHGWTLLHLLFWDWVHLLRSFSSGLWLSMQLPAQAVWEGVRTASSLGIFMAEVSAPAITWNPEVYFYQWLLFSLAKALLFSKYFKYLPCSNVTEHTDQVQVLDVRTLVCIRVRGGSAVVVY